MSPYELHLPGSLGEATSLLRRLGDATVLSGGTSLVLLLQHGLVRPEHVVSLRRLRVLSGIARDPGGVLRIGAITTLREVERSPLVREHCAALADAFASVATVRIRNQATVGGAVAHADPAQDPPVMLTALDATIVIAADAVPDRSEPIDGFFVDVFTTALGAAELIVAVLVPPLPAAARSAYLKFLPRTADDYATVSVGAVAACAEDGNVVHLRIALGAVGPTVIRARRVEAALIGRRPDDPVLREAAALVREEVDPFDDTRGSAGYKREMAAVWTERALRRVLG